MKWVVLSALVVLVAGCITQAPSAPVCNKPYILVGTECCLDENDDGICDKDKPVCKKPYTLVGKECCLDENGDGICDRDQAATSTALAVTTLKASTTVASTTATSPSVTSTTAPENAEVKCTAFSDCPTYDLIKCDGDGRAVHDTYGPMMCRNGRCVYRSSRDIATSVCNDWEVCVSGVGCVRKSLTTTTSSTSTVQGESTTTTLSAEFQKILTRVAERAAELSAAAKSTTTSTLPACLDPDGGRRFDIRSVNVSGIYWYNNSYVSQASEFCQDSQRVVEYYCVSDSLYSNVHDCESRCVDGRCCGSEGNVCGKDSDCCTGRCKMVGLTNHCVSS
jgi:hypothetical protein